MRTLGALLFCVAMAGVATGAEGQCMFGGGFYAPRAVACNDGTQQQCVDGVWRSTGLGCAKGNGRVMLGVTAPDANAVAPPRQPAEPGQPTARQPPSP